MKLRSLIKKGKGDVRGQVISITAFFVIVLSIFILGMLLMSFVNTILNPVASTLGEISNQSGTAVTAVNTAFNDWFDIAIIILFFLNVVTLLISSYMIDTHPIFLIVYVISVFLLIVFGGNVVGALGDIWADDGYFGTSNLADGGNSVQYMPLTQYILNHFTLVMLGLIIISGIIMYAKIKTGGGGQGY